MAQSSPPHICFLRRIQRRYAVVTSMNGSGRKVANAMSSDVQPISMSSGTMVQLRYHRKKVPSGLAWSASQLIHEGQGRDDILMNKIPLPAERDLESSPSIHSLAL